MENFLKHYQFKKWHLVPAVALLVVVMVLIGSKGEKTEVEVVRIERGEIVESILCSGKVRPVMEVAISPDVSGEIVELRVCEGSQVQKGDTLLKIRQDLYISIVERARATVGSLEAVLLRQQANMMQADLNLKRAEKLYEASAISRAELESARTERAMMKGQLDAAAYDARSGRAALKEAMDNLTKTVIVAPAAGTVSHLNVELGERVVGTSQMAGTVILSIADFGNMEVVADVGENDVVKLREEQKADIEIDAFGDMVFGGSVTKVANSSKMMGAGLGQIANFEVRIAVESETGQLRPGMSASAAIVTCRRDKVLKVPVSAVFIRDGREYVWRVDVEDRVSAVAIETGIQDISHIEVREGLYEGDRIVSAPHQAIAAILQEGSQIKIRK